MPFIVFVSFLVYFCRYPVPFPAVAGKKRNICLCGQFGDALHNEPLDHFFKRFGTIRIKESPDDISRMPNLVFRNTDGLRLILGFCRICYDGVSDEFISDH